MEKFQMTRHAPGHDGTNADGDWDSDDVVKGCHEHMTDEAFDALLAEKTAIKPRGGMTLEELEREDRLDRLARSWRELD